MQSLVGSKLQALLPAPKLPSDQQQQQQRQQCHRHTLQNQTHARHTLSSTSSSSDITCRSAARACSSRVAAATSRQLSISQSSAAATAGLSSGACAAPDSTNTDQSAFKQLGSSSAVVGSQVRSAVAEVATSPDHVKEPHLNGCFQHSLTQAVHVGMYSPGSLTLSHALEISHALEVSHEQQQQQQHPGQQHHHDINLLNHQQTERYGTNVFEVPQLVQIPEAGTSTAAVSVDAKSSRQEVCHSSHLPVDSSGCHSSSSSGVHASDHGSSSRQLVPKTTDQITACRSASELQQLLQGNWDHMDAVQVSAAFVQLARIQQQQQQEGTVDQATWESLQQAALQQLPNLWSRQCSSIIWACARLGQQPSAPLLEGLLARSQAHLQRGTKPQGFSNTLWGLATMGVQPSAHWLQDFFAASEQQLCYFEPQELSNTLWALAQLQRPPPDTWLTAFVAASASKLGAGSTQSLCNSLWAVARLNLSVPDHWWAAVTYACSIRAAYFTPAGVCQALWAAGMLAQKQQALQLKVHMRQQQQQQLQQVLVQVQQQQEGQRVACSKSGWGYTVSSAPSLAPEGDKSAAGQQTAAAAGSTDWIQPLLMTVEPQLGALDSKALSSLLWALAALRHNPGDQFVQNCVRCIARQGDLTATGAVHTLWAVSCLTQQAPQDVLLLLQPVMAQLQEQQQQLEQCCPRDLVYLAWSLAKLARQQPLQPHGPSLEHQQQDQQQQDQQHSFSVLPPLPAEVHADAHSRPSAAAMTPDSFVDLGWLAHKLLSASRVRLQDFGMGQLCQMARWLAAARVTPDSAWLTAFLAATAQRLHTLQPAQQLLLLHSVGQWQHQCQPGWGSLLLGSCCSPAAVSRYTAAHVGALLQAFATAELQPDGHHLRPLLQHVLQPSAQLDVTAVAAVLQGLFALGFRPPDGWVRHFWAQGASAMQQPDAAGVTQLASVLQHPYLWQLSLRPNKPFAAALYAAVAKLLPRPPSQLQLQPQAESQLQPQQAGTILMGLAAAGLSPQGGGQEVLPSALMAVAVKELRSMHLKDVIGVWSSLVQLRVLSAAVPLELLPVTPVAAAQQQDQAWLQQQWQILWLRRVFSSSRDQLLSLQPASLLQVADGLQRLQQLVPASWADAFVSAVTVHIHGLSLEKIHMLFMAMPCLRGAATVPAFAEKLMEAAAPHVQKFTPNQLSDIMCSIEQAGLKPGESWLKGIVAAASAQLLQFRPRQLTRLLTALARLRFMPDAGFLAAATDAAVSHLPGYKVHPCEMCDLLWSVVALRVKPSAAWLARFEARLLQRGTVKLNGQQLSRLGWCFAVLQHRPGPVLWAHWLAATQQAMPSMDAHSLADTLWTCAMLDEPPSKAWLDTFTSCSQQHMQTFSTNSLVTVVWSLALLQHRPSSSWMLDCLTALSQCLEATAICTRQQQQQGQQEQQQQQFVLSRAQLSRVTWSLAALDSLLPSPFLNQLLQLCLEDVPQLDADGLAQMVWAWDRLDATLDKQYVRRIAAEARTQLLSHTQESMGGRLEAGLMGSITSLGQASRPIIADLPLQRPAAHVRIGQKRLLLRSDGGIATQTLMVTPSEQQQQQQRPQPGGGLLLAGSSPFIPCRELVVGGSKVKLGNKQQLLATLQRLYASEPKASAVSEKSTSGRADDGRQAELPVPL